MITEMLCIDVYKRQADNLLENAVRYAQKSIVLQIKKKDGFLIISVFDIVFLSHIAYTINTQKSQKRGGVSMATSSITHNFVVSNPNLSLIHI